MKIAVMLARIFLGAVFFVFGLNGFFVFIQPPPMSGEAASFMGILISSGMLYAVKAVEVAGGLLMLLNRYPLLAITLLTPVAVTIFLFHLFLDPQLLPMAILIIAALGIIIYAYWEHLQVVLKDKPARR